MDDLVARYTLKFNDLASRGLLRAAGAARAFNLAGKAALIGVGALATASVAVGAYVVKTANAYGQWLDTLDETAAKTGLNINYLRNLQGAMGELGVEQEQLVGGMTKFNIVLGKLRLADDAVKSFGALSILSKDAKKEFIKASGASKGLNALAPGLAKSLTLTKNTTQASQTALAYLGGVAESSRRAAIAVALFGKGAGAAIAGATSDLAELNARARVWAQLGGDLTGGVNAASDYADAVGRVKGAMQALLAGVGAEALPVLTTFATQFVKYVRANASVIKSGISDFFRKFAKAVKEIDFEKVGAGITSLAANLPKLAGALAFVIDNAVVIGSVFAGIKVAGMLASFGALSPIIAGIGTGFSVLAAAIPYVAGLFGVLVAAVGWPVIAFAALVAGGVLLYRNWDTVKSKLSELAGAFGISAGSISRAWATAMNLVKVQLNGVLTVYNAVAGALTGAKPVKLFTLDQSGYDAAFTRQLPGGLTGASQRAPGARAAQQRIGLDVNISGGIKNAQGVFASTTSRGAAQIRGSNKPAPLRGF
jgi:hypothetical protein